MLETKRWKVVATTRQMRLLLGVAAILVLIAGVQLFVLTDHTDRYFAWTIGPPITAAFLGAAYWSSFVLELLAAGRQEWARARIAVPTALTFTSLTLTTTLLDLNRFHLGDNDLGAQIAAWAWLVVYVAVPPAFLLVIIRQLREPGFDPPRNAPVSRPIKVTLRAQGVVLAFVGLLLFLVPQVIEPIWPWTLTPLTGRAIGSWFLAMSVAAFHALWEDDLDRILPGMVSYIVFGLLQLVALVRYGVWVRWSNAGAWLYLLLCLSMVVVGFAGIYNLRRKTQRPTQAAVTTPLQSQKIQRRL